MREREREREGFNMRYIYVKYYAYAVWPIEMKMQCTSKNFKCMLHANVCVYMCVSVCVGASVCVHATFQCNIFMQYLHF